MCIKLGGVRVFGLAEESPVDGSLPVSSQRLDVIRCTQIIRATLLSESIGLMPVLCHTLLMIALQTEVACA